MPGGGQSGDYDDFGICFFEDALTEEEEKTIEEQIKLQLDEDLEGLTDEEKLAYLEEEDLDD